MTEPASLFAPRSGASLLRDGLGRSVSYLRLSVTDRCNLRCRYCRVDNHFIPHDQILRYEEMEDLVGLAVEMGVSKVRLTGGEPLARKGFCDFLQRLRRRFPAIDLRITSNGTLMAPHAALLKEVGAGVNLSLDSFDPENFAAITGRAMLPQVLQTVDALLHHGVRLKINAVALKGVNDQELPLFLDFARQHPVDVRFIEFMPMGGASIWSEANFWPAAAILEQARQWAELEATPRQSTEDGPARLYTIAGGQGRFGLITPLSDHFCASCNRLRVTSDGRLRTCLFDDREYPLAPLLHHPRLGLNAARRVMLRALERKPLGAQILRERHGVTRSMTAIGG